MKALGRRLARLEAMREYMDDLVSPETLHRMAAIVLESPLDQNLRAEAEGILGQKPLRPDAAPSAGMATA